MTSIAFTFARMNPPTIGHERLVEVLKSLPEGKANDRFIYLSPTENNDKNPLSHERRVELVSKAFYDSSIIVSEMKLKDVFAVLDHVYWGMGYTEVVVVVGSDRFAELKKRIPMYNGKLYHFSRIEVIDAGHRDETASDISGMSASKLREAAKLGDYATFENGLPTKLRPLANDIFEEVKACLSTHLEAT